MPRESISTKLGRMKSGLRNSLAMPASEAWFWIDSLAYQGPGLSPNQAVGLDRPELKPLEKAIAFVEGGSPLL